MKKDNKVDEKVLDAADKVMIPELMVLKTQLAGVSVNVRALPVYYAKQVYNILKPIQTEVSDWVAEFKSAKNLPLVPPDTDMDVRMAEAMLKVCVVLADFYELGLSEETLDKKVGLDELTIFIKAQLEVSRDSDFLLRPLQIIMKGLDLLQVMKPYQNLDPSEVLQNLGA